MLTTLRGLGAGALLVLAFHLGSSLTVPAPSPIAPPPPPGAPGLCPILDGRAAIGLRTCALPPLLDHEQYRGLREHVDALGGDR